MFCMGLDIGYSNLKVQFGKKDEGSSRVLPVGVAPDMGKHGFGLDGHLKDAVRVVVDDSAYFAGISPDRVPEKPRSLHADYPSTVDYRALFNAALLLSSTQSIDRLVTGLPVEHYLNKEQVKKLTTALKGEHKITPKRTVEVKNVTVVPQPIGGYMTAFKERPEIEQMRVLILDPGFFSVDWVVIRDGAVEPGTMGTSLKAMSVLLEEASSLIQSEHGGRVIVEDIERAIRSGKSSIMLFGENIEIAPYLAQASKTVGDMVMTAVKAEIRGVKAEVDAVLLVGGGSSFYTDAAHATFPRAKLIKPANAVTANAEGFWHLGLEA
jgi:plasmid segregation protein ParM